MIASRGIRHSGGFKGAVTVAVGCALALGVGPLAVASPTLVYGACGLLAVLAALAFTSRCVAGNVIVVVALLVAALCDLPQHVHMGPTTGQGAETVGLVAVLLLLVLNGYSGVGVPSVRHLWPFAVFLIWTGMSLSWGDAGQQALQNVLVYASFVLMLLVGATLGRWSPVSSYRVVNNAFYVAAALGLSLYGVSYVIGGHGNRVVISPRPFGLFGVLVVAWFMAAHIGGSRSAKWIVAATVLLTVLSLSRSALAAQLLIIVLAQLGTTTNFRTLLKAGALFTTVAAIALTAVFLYPPLHHRFFGGDKQQVAGLSVNVSGRDALWSANWAWFKERPVVGWGAGSSDRMTSTLPGSFSSHPHNDYLRLMVDFGLVGLVLWCVGYLALMRLTWTAWRASQRERTSDGRVQAAAFLALAGIAVTMLVDNPLIEVGKMAPLGALVGLALGTAAARGSAQAVPRPTGDSAVLSRHPGRVT